MAQPSGPGIGPRPVGVPFLIAAVLGTEKVPAQLPVLADPVEPYRRSQRVATVLACIGFTVTVTGARCPDASASMIVAGFVTLAGGLATAATAGRRLPHGRPDDTGLSVRPPRRPPDFVAAVEARGRAPE